MPLNRSVVGWGPFTKGIVDGANSSLDLSGALRRGRHLVMRGLGQLRAAPGLTRVCTLQDDAAPAAEISRVLATGPYKDGAYAIGWSAATQRVYLYLLNSTLTAAFGQPDAAPGGTIAPTAVCWTGLAAAPDVTVQEGLGYLYIAGTSGALQSLQYTGTDDPHGDGSNVPYLTGDLENPDTVCYFTGLIAFQRHLWGFGFGTGTGASPQPQRPEMARFSTINFGADDTTMFMAGDSVTIGDRLRSQRERIVGGGIAGDAMYLGGTGLLTRVTGYDRDSWFLSPVDRSYGFAGPHCMVTAGDVLHYWSPRGPMRIGANTRPEPLWGAIPNTVLTTIDPSKVIAGFDPDADRVVYIAQRDASGPVAIAAFDIQRDLWLDTEGTLPVQVACAGLVDPVLASTVAPPGPAAAPSVLATVAIGTTAVTLTWVQGDYLADTQLRYRLAADGGSQPGPWVEAPLVPRGQTSYRLTGLIAGALYDWTAQHVRNGQTTAEIAGPQYRMVTQLAAPDLYASTPSGRQSVISFYHFSNPDATVVVDVWGPAQGFPAPADPDINDSQWREYGRYQPGVSSFTFTSADGYNVPGGLVYWFRARCEQAGANTSPETGPVKAGPFTQ